MPLETAETGSIGSGSDRDDHVSRRRAVGHACCLEVCKTSRLFRKENEHTACAVPAGTNFLRSGKFQKDLILFVVRCYLGVLNRGLQNLDVLAKRTDCHFLRCAKSNQKAHGTPSCDLDSNLRSIHNFGENDRRSSCNRPRRELKASRVSTVRI